jgi:hypothetical protein
VFNIVDIMLTPSISFIKAHEYYYDNLVSQKKYHMSNHYELTVVRSVNLPHLTAVIFIAVQDHMLV